MPDSDSFQSAVGRFLASYREQHEITLDQVARAAKKFGAAWGVQSVRNIQSGTAAPTLPTLITLALALREITGEELALSELLGDATSIAPPTALDLPFQRKWVDAVLAGGPISVRSVSNALDGGEAKVRQIVQVVPDSLSRVFADLNKHWPPNLDWEEFEANTERLSREAPTLAEQRAAHKLRIPVEALRYWAIHLWGQSLEGEARARAGGGATPQARGAATRVLVAEIREKMSNHRDG